MIEYAVLCVEPQPDGLSAVRELLPSNQYAEVAAETVTDDNPAIRRALRTFTDIRGLELILTIGGSTVGTRERVPEVTQELIERPIPGLAELMRLAGIQKSRRAALWRGLTGQRNKTLIVNLPAEDTRIALEAIAPVLPLTVSSIKGG
ncbi:MAG: MogA/MoaB family molybdenum cofactor biosynthesis protein [Pleurocapsa sp. SU_196_0]|nr:MogA/MoaB family molybdenum cofactor biosynthesis protein [Pleurocapsa sp. SU_196_0]